MTLFQKQVLFTQSLPLLLQEAKLLKFDVTLGEVYRTPEQAKLNAQTGKGIANSVHTLRLAVDINLFKDGKYLTNTSDYKELGEFWESLSTPNTRFCWGGRFTRQDGNHFSIEHNGVR